VIRQSYLLGPADPVLRHSSSDIELSLKASLLVKPRVSLVPAMVFDAKGIQDILYRVPQRPEEIGPSDIRTLAVTKDLLSQNRPLLTVTAMGKASTGIEFFEEWSGLGGRFRKDPVYSSTLSDVIDTNQSTESYLRHYPRFQQGVETIDKVFIEAGAIDVVHQTYEEPFKRALRADLENVADAGSPQMRPLACHLLGKLDEPDSLSRSFIVKGCQQFLGVDIYHHQYAGRNLLAFREEIIDRNWRISHASSVGGNLWDGFQRKAGILKRLVPLWYRASLPLETVEIPYEGKYLSEISLKQILELRDDNDYLNQLKAIQDVLARSKTHKLDQSAFARFLDKLAEKFPSAKGDSPRKKMIKLARIPAAFGWTADVGVKLLSPILAQLAPDVIVLGDIIAGAGSLVSVAIWGLARRASDEPTLTRQFKAFGIRLAKV
jgi:hypothetical protein